MGQWIGSALVQIMACRLLSAKPLSEPMMGYCQLNETLVINFGEILNTNRNFHSRKCIWNYRLRNGSHFVQREMSQRVQALTLYRVYVQTYTWNYNNYPLVPIVVLQTTIPSIEGSYCQTSNISCTLVGKDIVDHSDVVGASPVGAAPTTSSFSN